MTGWSASTRPLEWDVFERPLDPLSPTARCTTPLDAIDGDTLLSGTAADALRRDGVALTAALQLGVALAAVDLANEYAKGREQFGRPIGSFQAVKHLLAEMLVKAEVARSAVYAAACAFDGASDGRRELVPCRRPRSWLGRQPCSTARRASRCTAGWASPGRCTPSATGSGPSCSTPRSAPPTITRWPSRATL
jgi:hypothetical protein